MVTLSTEVLVIGGGATGTGVAWDAALRGYDVVLVDRRDLAEGTSGRFHGLLHSGGRYAVKDPRAAVECIEREPDPASRGRGLHRGHRRAVRDHARRRLRLRRSLRPGLRRHRRGLRGDQHRRGARLRAPGAPRDLPGLPRPRRQHRCVEDGVGDEPRRPAARRPDPPLPRGDRDPSRRRRGHRRPSARRAHRRGARHPRARDRERGGRVGGADRRPGRHRGGPCSRAAES